MKGKLTDDEVEKLNEIAFTWEPLKSRPPLTVEEEGESNSNQEDEAEVQGDSHNDECFGDRLTRSRLTQSKMRTRSTAEVDRGNDVGDRRTRRRSSRSNKWTKSLAEVDLAAGTR